MKPFQIILIAAFGVFAVMGFLCFAGIVCDSKGGGPRGAGGVVEVWGSLPRGNLERPLRALNERNENAYSVSYREIREENFDRELIEALASGEGPDLIFLPHDLILRHEDKVVTIPHESYNERTFKDTFVEQGELYLTPEGVLGFPFSIDPIVMYWNRDIFADEGVAEAPKAWDEFLALSSRLTETDAALNIRRSAIAFGEYRNVDHAKDIISMLVIQAGNPIIERREGAARVIFSDQRGFVTAPAQSALRFYTDFSNPVKPVYSWNRALPASEDFFAAGDLAVYFGYASEYDRIREKGPHLNFDVSVVPQTRDVPVKATFGRVTGVALLKRSTNRNTAFLAMQDLTSREFIEQYAAESGLPPVRRDLLSAPQTDAIKSIFYQSALISEGWLDPEPQETSRIFQTMVENIVSGRSAVSSAVSTAHKEMQSALGR